MAIELVTCSTCGTKNALDRKICLSCGQDLKPGVIWASGSELQKSFRELVESAPNINPERIWKSLTFCVRLFALIVAMSAGGWLAAFLVPPDRLTRYDYEEAKRWADISRHLVEADRSIVADHPEFVQSFAAGQYEEFLLKRQWRTRDKVQGTSEWVFIPSLVLLGLFHWMRKDPYIFDVTLSKFPKVISRRIPYFIARWRVSILDENGNEREKDFHRTGAKANQKGERLAHHGAKVRIVWDNSAYHWYRLFINPGYLLYLKRMAPDVDWERVKYRK